jgi:hypothetical protein
MSPFLTALSVKEIERRDKSTNSIDVIENKKCLLIGFWLPRLESQTGGSAKTWPEKHRNRYRKLAEPASI